jgi:hypothetical protein
MIAAKKVLKNWWCSWTQGFQVDGSGKMIIGQDEMQFGCPGTEEPVAYLPAVRNAFNSSRNTNRVFSSIR